MINKREKALRKMTILIAFTSVLLWDGTGHRMK